MRLTADQRRFLRVLPSGGLYEGALPLYTGFDEGRCRVLVRQLRDRGLIERRWDVHPSVCWRRTHLAEAALYERELP